MRSLTGLGMVDFAIGTGAGGGSRGICRKASIPPGLWNRNSVIPNLRQALARAVRADVIDLQSAIPSSTRRSSMPAVIRDRVPRASPPGRDLAPPLPEVG